MKKYKMMNNSLQSLISFVQNERKNINLTADSVFAMRVCKYTDFLLKKIEPGIFVPCDSNGNYLEKPYKNDFFKNGIYRTDDYRTALKEYEAAKAKVLFENFYVKYDDWPGHEHRLSIFHTDYKYYFAAITPEFIWHRTNESLLYHTSMHHPHKDFFKLNDNAMSLIY